MQMQKFKEKVLNIQFILIFFLISNFAFAEKIAVTERKMDSLLIAEEFDASASVLLKNEPEISSEISAKILEIPMNSGDVVQKGEILVKLKCDTFIQNKKAAFASFKKAESQFKYEKRRYIRAEKLKGKKSISDDAFENFSNLLEIARADLENQKARLRLSEIRVKNCNIKAPFAALVKDRILSEGDFANIGKPLMSLVQLSDVEIKADIESSQVFSLKKSKNIVFYFRDGLYAVKIRSISPIINRKNNTQEVRLRFSRDTAPIGSIGRIKWSKVGKFLPAEYLIRQGNDLGIFIIKDGLAKFVKIPDAIEGQPVLTSIPSNARIIIEGRKNVTDGSQLRIMTEYAE